jgi:hypothetical protein
MCRINGVEIFPLELAEDTYYESIARCGVQEQDTLPLENISGPAIGCALKSFSAKMR